MSFSRDMAKTMEYEDTELTSPHGHTKNTTDRETMYENDPETSRKDFPPLKI